MHSIHEFMNYDEWWIGELGHGEMYNWGRDKSQRTGDWYSTNTWKVERGINSIIY